MQPGPRNARPGRSSAATEGRRSLPLPAPSSLRGVRRHQWRAPSRRRPNRARRVAPTRLNLQVGRLAHRNDDKRRAEPAKTSCIRHERMLNRCSTGQARVACWVGSLATNHMGPSLGATIPHAFPTTRSPRWRSATITPCQKSLASAERGGSSPLSDTNKTPSQKRFG